MQDLSLQLSQVSPVKKGMAQDQKGFQAAEQNDLGAPHAFADMFKKQVNQQKAKPVTAPAANVPPAVKPPVANKRQEMAQVHPSTSKPASETSSKDNSAKPNTAKEVDKAEHSDDDATHENQGIQDLIFMQLGLQAPGVITAQANADSAEPLPSLTTATTSTDTLSLASEESAAPETALSNDTKPIAEDATAQHAAPDLKRTPNPQAEGLKTTPATVALNDARQELSPEKLAKLQANADLSAPNAVARPEFNTVAQTAASQVAQEVAGTHHVRTAFGKADWNQAINQRVVYMLGAGEQTATLTLNPPNLGPLQVVIKVDNDHVDTTFMSNNADVRQALQDGLGMLKDKLSESGIQLGNANVSTNEQSQRDFQQAAQNRAQQRTPHNGLSADDATVVSTPIVKSVSNGLVDTFA